jgi:hypothetical protein
MGQLPFVDEHARRVDAPADAVGTALLRVLRITEPAVSARRRP